MKKRSLLVLAFLLALYIVPSILGPSSSHASLLTEPNMTKEFSVASFWYDDAWLYRKQVAVVEQAGAGTNYQIPIVGYFDDPTKDIAGSIDFEGLCEEDFADIRFTSGNGFTYLDYWIDSIGYAGGTSAKFWVEVKADVSLTASNVTIFVYFGNDAATSASSITNTFVFAEDFISALDSNKWDTVDNAPAIGSGVAVFTRPSGVDSQHSVIIADDTLADGNYRVRCLWKWGADNINAQRYSYFGFGGSYIANPTIIGAVVRDYSSSTNTMKLEEFDSDADVSDDDETFGTTTTSYQDFELHWLSGAGSTIYATLGVTTVSKVKAYATVLRPTLGISDSGVSAPSAITLTVDFIYVSKWQVTEPTFAAPGEIESDESPSASWDIVDSQQLLFETLDWALITTAIVKFLTPVDETLVNWLLIFLGLFMIPASTLYLVKGGKDGMSANKFFYFCIAFMLGWGLLLGGIYG